MRTFFFCVVMIFTSLQVYSASLNQVLRSIPQDSTTKVLKLTNLKNQQAHYLVPGMTVNYWYIQESQKFRRKGVLQGFSGDSLIIEGEKIPLSGLKRIEKRNKSEVKAMFGVGALQLAGLGIIGGAVLIQQDLWDFSTSLGFIAIILGTIFFFIGWRLLKRPGKINKVYKPEILEGSVETLKEILKLSSK